MNAHKDIYLHLSQLTAKKRIADYRGIQKPTHVDDGKVIVRI